MHDPRALRILLVEDNFLVSTVVEDAIADAGHQLAAVATSAAEALDLAARAGPIDLALVDIDLDDGRSGVDLARQLRRRFGIATLYATGQGEVARDNPTTALGVLDKPFTAAEVVLSVAAARAILAGRAPAFCPRNLHLFAAAPVRAEARAGDQPSPGL